MKEVFQIYFFVFLCGLVLGSSEDDEENVEDESTDDENTIDRADGGETDLDSKVPTSNCWMSLNTAEHFKILDEIDDRYAEVREQVQESLKKNDFDKSMIKGMKQSRGVAFRESYAVHQLLWMIPSGLNLGGFCMLRMPNSILFFHRMKLRNDTHFRVDFLYNDLANMMVTINLGLNDLHLKGAFERSLTEEDPSILIYSPSFGQVEFLLKDVRYKMEGRYRMIQNRLMIELVSSEILVDEVLMTYINQAIESSAIKIEKANLGSFMSRLKTDLDKWIKDYFNDYMIYAKMDGIPNLQELAKYDKEKGTALEEFTDNSIQTMATRIRHLNADSISLPTFTFNAVTGLQVKLYKGVINGLDSMYRRSVATGYKQGGIRKVDSIIGFSNLKVVYKYEAWIPTGIPPLAGVLTLSSNELTAHLALAMVLEPETIDLDIEILDEMKPQSLTVEGGANIMISNFKHLLEHQILATMSNTLNHGLAMLKSLPRCEPFVPGEIKDKKGPEQKQNEFSDVQTSDSPESDELLLRGKTEPQRISTKYPQSLMKQSNRSGMKKNQTELKKYKGMSKKRYNRKPNTRNKLTPKK